ncbi:GIY-YIG nuclease family protein [Pedobacter frigiditerrae]|uniref:GIY-YIG nuclease family protein n=1 Tax=Pedobacter frigiditerrae TaxID=2530452 RepID=A0A4R0MKV9_9SPHI|nr:GIY-YIG nuclease family protein [Pedobacter frigiditerrae]TCC87251.1 GIY-YIG nuclease family protein [Pedobacter frigiditerrae]
MERGGCVYILTNVFNTVLYIGVTSDLFSRIAEHKDKLYPKSFTAKYDCNKLVFYEMYSTIEEAIGMEKRLKKWNRDWKIKLIEKNNPMWLDLYSEDL